MEQYLKIVKQIERHSIRKRPLWTIKLSGFFYRRKPLEAKQHYLRVKQAQMLQKLSRETAWIEKKASFLWKQSYTLMECQKQREQELVREYPPAADAREQAVQRTRKEDALAQWEQGRLEMIKLKEALVSIREIARLRISRYQEYLRQYEHAFCTSARAQMLEHTDSAVSEPETYWNGYSLRLQKVQEFLKEREE